MKSRVKPLARCFCLAFSLTASVQWILPSIAAPTLYDDYSKKAKEYMDQRHSRFPEAEKFLRAALFQAKRFGTDDRRYRTTLRDLAELNYQKADFRDAIPLFTQSIALSQRAVSKLKSRHASQAEIAEETREWVADLADLADCYRGTSKYQQAAANYHRGLNLLDSLGKENTLQRAELESELADVYTVLGKYQEAEKLYEKAMARLAEKKNDPKVDKRSFESVSIDTLQDYAMLLRSTNRVKQGDELLSEMRKMLGLPEHPATIRDAHAFDDAKKLPEAGQ
ncbi:MAG: tetratricopeptide repeat protein [Candidatus Obscuribacterales bacterium]|nr:tetratricopeptide repeat protein [Candidatus Obscuribacterales bacterium]